MKSHKDLDVWKAATQLAASVYGVTNSLPQEERFGLTSQMRRAAVSVASNIAEGAARRTDKEFIHFLHTAAGSASELDTQIEICRLVAMGDNQAFDAIQAELDRVCRMIQGLIRSVRARC